MHLNMCDLAVSASVYTQHIGQDDRTMQNSQVIAGTAKTSNKPTTMQTHSVLISLLSLSDSIHYIGIHTENIIWTGLESCLEVSWGYKRYADFIRTQQLQCDRSWVMCSMSLHYKVDEHKLENKETIIQQRDIIYSAVQTLQSCLY